jgi:hypothetical protein
VIQRPRLFPRLGDMILAVSVAAFACGVSLLAAEIGSLDAQLATLAVAPPARATRAESNMVWPTTPAEPDAFVIGRIEMRSAQEAQRPAMCDCTPLSLRWHARERFAEDGPLPFDRTAIGMTGDARQYLLDTAAARWSHAKRAWDESSGYGAVEANRVTIDVHVPPSDD